jgi:hypothetical protein
MKSKASLAPQPAGDRDSHLLSSLSLSDLFVCGDFHREACRQEQEQRRGLVSCVREKDDGDMNGLGLGNEYQLKDVVHNTKAASPPLRSPPLP